MTAEVIRESPRDLLRLINAAPRYRLPALIEPTSFGYIHVGAEVNAPHRPGPVFFRGRYTATLLRDLKRLSRELERECAVRKATVYRAVAFAPPVAYARQAAAPLPRFDVAILVEMDSVEAAAGVQAGEAYQQLLRRLTVKARRVHTAVMRNAKRIADVDRSRQGLFLFNYFVAQDAAVAVALWDYLAGWYMTETGLNNSTLLVPQEGEHFGYPMINHARWDMSLPRFLWEQLSKRSFRTYVQANLRANRVGPMPVLYRLV